MSKDTHEQHVALYKDLGSIYSYGYGALREAYRSFHEAERTLDEYVTATQRIISAVEFRTAELMAEQVIKGLEADKEDRFTRISTAQGEASAIYDVPQEADAIARDQ